MKRGRNSKILSVVQTSVVAAAAAKSLQSCPTLCDPIDGSPPGSLPWDSPGKNTGVGCHFLLHCMKVKSKSEVAQSCPTLSDPMDCSLLGSSIHGIFQATVLEWGAIAFSCWKDLIWKKAVRPRNKGKFCLKNWELCSVLSMLSLRWLLQKEIQKNILQVIVFLFSSSIFSLSRSFLIIVISKDDSNKFIF